MKKLLLFCLLFLLIPCLALAVTLKITFDAPSDPTWKTVVIWGTTSGDYTNGQQSDPGDSEVIAGGFLPDTTYHFVAYRVDDTGSHSANSAEVTFDVPADSSLPDLPPNDPIVIEVEAPATITIQVN